MPTALVCCGPPEPEQFLFFERPESVTQRNELLVLDFAMANVVFCRADRACRRDMIGRREPPGISVYTFVDRSPGYRDLRQMVFAIPRRPICSGLGNRSCQLWAVSVTLARPLEIRSPAGERLLFPHRGQRGIDFCQLYGRSRGRNIALGSPRCNQARSG